MLKSRRLNRPGSKTHFVYILILTVQIKLLDLPQPTLEIVALLVRISSHHRSET